MMRALILAPYREAEHYPLLTQWWAGHGVPAVPPRWLSPLGVVAYDGPPSEGGTALAACFLYPTIAPAVGMMEQLVSNPAAPKRLQARALDAVMHELLEIGRANGMELVTAMTERPHVERRAARHGFKELVDYRCLAVVMARAAPQRKEA